MKPLFSIVIAVYNDWTALDSCLDSINRQTGTQDFAVIVVDDGSDESAPSAIVSWTDRLPLRILREAHAGIPTARNRGIQVSNGSILLFVDADCRLQPNCLVALASVIAASPQQKYFQLRLTGDSSIFMGRTEHLRLTALQNRLVQPNGLIRYLNTAGFAIRRSSVAIEEGLFNPAALRAEDTLLLTELMQRGELPLFVGGAIVEHTVPASLLKCLRKDMRSAFLEGRTYALIASRGIRIRMTLRERWSMLRWMWLNSKTSSTGRLACVVLIIRQSLSRFTSLVYWLLHNLRVSHSAHTASTDGKL